MKIVLLENVDHLGIAGDVKEVATGYARNFLLPQRKAVVAGDRQAKDLLKNISVKRQEAKAEIKKIQKTADLLDGKTIEFVVSVNEKGKLFASITAADVAKKMQVETNILQMSPIKETGTHKVKVYFGHDIKANIEVVVMAEKETTKTKNK